MNNDKMVEAQAKEILKESWHNLVASGDMSSREMKESLQDQVDEYTDMSAEELTDELTEIMGWEPGPQDDEELEQWTRIVNGAAAEFLQEMKQE